MSSGLAGGFMATMLTQPFDMIKTRLQLKPKEYKNMLFACRKILHEESMLGFFSGMIPRVLRKSFSSAISWTVYEEVVKHM
jgi:solute carrier family 25, member 38